MNNTFRVSSLHLSSSLILLPAFVWNTWADMCSNTIEYLGSENIFNYHHEHCKFFSFGTCLFWRAENYKILKSWSLYARRDQPRGLYLRKAEICLLWVSSQGSSFYHLRSKWKYLLCSWCFSLLSTFQSLPIPRTMPGLLQECHSAPHDVRRSKGWVGGVKGLRL